MKNTGEITLKNLSPLTKSGVFDGIAYTNTSVVNQNIKAIQKVVGPNVQVVDSARNCAVALQQLLNDQDLKADESASGGLHVSLTDTPDHFLGVAKEALNLNIGEIEIRGRLPVSIPGQANYHDGIPLPATRPLSAAAARNRAAKLAGR